MRKQRYFKQLTPEGLQSVQQSSSGFPCNESYSIGKTEYALTRVALHMQTQQDTTPIGATMFADRKEKLLDNVYVVDVKDDTVGEEGAS